MKEHAFIETFVVVELAALQCTYYVIVDVVRLCAAGQAGHYLTSTFCDHESAGRMGQCK